MGKLLLRGLAVALVLSLTVHAWGQGQGNAKAIIEKGIIAQGGAKNLAKTLITRMQGKGNAFFGDQKIPFTIDVHQQLPGKLRTALKLDIQGMEIPVLQVVNGDKGWNQIMGMTTDADADSLAQSKVSLHAARVSALVPLVTEKGFKLTSLGESNINGKPALGVKVTSAGQKDISLYFDKDNGLLVKLTRPGVDPTSKNAVTQDEYYSDYKERDGVKQPSKIVVNHDGKKFMEATVTEITYPATIEEKMFTKPE